MTLRNVNMWRTAISAGAVVLAGCGGGGGGGGSAGGGTTPLAVTVIDGVIKNALVCLDINSNGGCDATEPQGKTDANGQVTLSVATADANKYPVLAVVDTDAIDKDTGPVLTRYTMQAPKDAASLVTPLTTLVQATVSANGVSTQQAADAVQEQLSLTTSPLADFTKTKDTQAQAVANAVVTATQEQSKAVKGAVGNTVSGTPITQADVDKLVAQKVVAMAPQLAQVAADSTVISASTPVDRVAAIKAKTDAILATDGIKDASSAVAALEMQKASIPETLPSTPVATAWLGNLNFKAVNDVYIRYQVSTVQENTPVDNKTKYRWLRYQVFPNGDAANWSVSGSPHRSADLRWTGSAWQVCDINNQNTSTLPDAEGKRSYNYCNGYETGQFISTKLDIAGKKMLDVYRSALDQGVTNLKIGATLADAEKLLGTQTFPVGSKLAVGVGSSQTVAPGYYPGAGNRVELSDAKLASGDTTACSASPAPLATTKATLEELVARFRGTPCVFTKSGDVTLKDGTKANSGDRNEGWGNTTLSLATLGRAYTVELPSQASSYYTGNKRIRVAFGDNNLAKYYVCAERYNGSTRNCDVAGTGTYVIEQRGDKRLMRFTGLPSIVKGAQNWDRVFVESAGSVYYGYQDLPTPSKSTRLNLEAANALLKQLGLSKTIQPDTDRVTLTAASYEGTYSGTLSGTVGGTALTGTFLFAKPLGGTATCSGTSTALVNASNTTGAFMCSNVTIVPGKEDSTKASITFGETTSGDTFSGTFDFYTGAIAGTWSQGTTATRGTFTGTRQ